MKKMIYVIAVFIMTAAIFTGCSDTTNVNSTNTSSQNSETESKTAEATDSGFESFIKYMSDNEYIKGDGEDLTASAIGAVRGKRYTITLNGSRIYVELYEFEDQTSELASKTISKAQESGTFSLYDSMESITKNTTAAVTVDGRFLMLYTDTSNNANNIDTKSNAVEAVKSYGKQN